MSKEHWLALLSVSGIGGATARKLIERFGSVEAVFETSADDLAETPRVSRGMAEQLLAVSLDEMASNVEALADAGIDLLTWDDDDYPPNLRTVSDAPPLLYVSGALLAGDADAVAIVGTREPSAAAEALAERLGREMAERGLTVVSGLALGIDTAAHRGALQARRGRTLAVLGGGLRAIFPPNNRDLAEAISERGAVLSELRPTTPATGPSLMARDRIVSGLSRAVIVVEANERSGTMDTARRARSQARLLIAVPGSPGARLLLEQGALRLAPENTDLDDLARRIRAHELGDADAPEQLGLL
jgi:DNA processing protein